MPPVPVPPSQWFLAQLAGQAQQVRGIASQQQETITNSLGQPLINFGLVPGSNPAEYGLQFVNPSTGAPIMLLGEDGSGNVAMQWFDGSGNLLWKQDATGSSWYNTSGALIRKDDAAGSHYYDGAGHEISRLDTAGLHVYNTSGTEEVAAGLLNSSPAIYGLGVLPYGATQLQQVGGSLFAGPLNYGTSTTSTWLSVGLTITAEIGPAGEALVACYGQVGTPGSSAEGEIGIAVDGGTPTRFGYVSSASSATGVLIGSTKVLTASGAGSHTFDMQINTGYLPSGQNCAFNNLTLEVSPL